MADYTEKLNLYEIDKVNDVFSTFDIDTVLNENWQKIDENVVNKNGTVEFVAEQLGVDPVSEQGLATKKYVDINTLQLGETETTAYRGDRGKIAYEHSQTIGNPHNTTKADIDLGNVKNFDTTTTANITDSIDKRFVTDIEKSKLIDISGINTGDETKDTIISKLGYEPMDDSLSNITTEGKSVITNSIMPDFTRGETKAWGTTYVAQCDGWLVVNAYAYGTQAGAELWIDNVRVYGIGTAGMSGFYVISVAPIPIAKDSSYFARYGNVSGCHLTFYPAKGA